MAAFWRSWRWKGVNRHGMKVSGTAFIAPAALRLQLWRDGIRLSRVRYKPQKRFTRRQKRLWQQAFTREWQVLLEAGIAQLDALQVIRAQNTSAEANAYLNQLITQLQDGHTLADALSQNKASFSEQYCRLVAVGEQSGQLAEILQRLSEQFALTESQRRELRKALTYPIIVLGVAGCVFFGMLYLVVPQFASLYLQLQVPVPTATQRLLDLADWLRQPRHLLLLTPTLLIVPALSWLKRLTQSRAGLMYRLYSLPLLGKTLRHAHLLQDISTLDMAYNSSIPLSEACLLTARSSVSAHFRQLWQRSERLLADGNSLHEALAQDPLIEPEYLQNIALGEQSGRLHQQLTFVAARLQQKLSDAYQRLMRSLEPTFLVITGAMTAALLLALYLPLFQLGQLVS